MKSAFVAMLCHTVIVTLIFASMPAQAGMISTERANAAESAQIARSDIQVALTRNELAQQLQAMGIDATAARDRVAALTDDEALALNGTLHSAPAGAGAEWAVAVIILIVFAWLYWYKRLR